MLNEAELLLVREWQTARQLEKTLEVVRKKYGALHDDVAATVTKECPELTVSKVRVTQFWAGGFIVFSKTEWRDGKSDDPPGLWMDQLRIERLTDPTRPAPTASVWLPKRVARGLSKSPAELRQTLQQASESIYTIDERSEIVLPETGGDAAIYFRAPSKVELIDLLTASDSAAFINRLSGIFRVMSRMIPVMDKILL